MRSQVVFQRFIGKEVAEMEKIASEAMDRQFDLEDCHPEIEEYSHLVTIGLFLLYQTADGTLDNLEHEAFNYFCSNRMSKEDYLAMGRYAHSEEGVIAVGRAVHAVLRLVPESRENLEDIAMSAILSNGEFTETEMKMFDTMFDY